VIVVDSNVIAYCWLNGPLTATAQRVRVREWGERGNEPPHSRDQRFLSVVLDLTAHRRGLRLRLAIAGNIKVRTEFDVPAVALSVKQLYHQIIEAKSCAM